MGKRNKTEKKILQFKYSWELMNQLFSVFDYENLPFRSEFLEWELQRMGFCAIAKHNDKIYVGNCSGWETDEYKLPCGSADFYTRGGYIFSGEIGKDIIIGYNNKIRTPELSVPYYADIFTEIDISIKNNILKSRLAPIPLAKDSNTATAINKALEDISDGNTKAIGSTNIANLTGSKLVDLLELTKPEEIERVQYLSKLFDDTLRRFWTKKGISMNSTGKMAQVNEMELEGYEKYSMIDPLSMLEERQLLLKEVNEKFGTNYNVKFSKAFEHLTQSENMEEREENENDI